jgi:hypothetical protein
VSPRSWQLLRKLVEPRSLIDRLRRPTVQRNHSMFFELRHKQAQTDSDDKLTLEEGLPIYQKRLIVPDTEKLRMDLIKEAHETYRQCRKGSTELSHLPKSQMPPVIVRQCSYTPSPFQQRPWQHVTMDFQLLSKGHLRIRHRLRRRGPTKQTSLLNTLFQDDDRKGHGTPLCPQYLPHPWGPGIHCVGSPRNSSRISGRNSVGC